jgi:hypothetical protein
VNDRLFFRNLDALDLFQFLDARLHLLGLGRLRAEAVDERFQMLDLLALVLIGRNELRLALFFLLQVFGVVARINLQRLFQISTVRSRLHPENTGHARSECSRRDNCAR